MAQVRLDLDEVMALSAARFVTPSPAPDDGSWPCPGCGERTPVSDAWKMRIRNRVGAPQERFVVVCSGCRSRLLHDVRH